MRAVIQRVSSAEVTIEGDVVGRIGAGLLILLGIGQNDGQDDVEWLASKIAALRIFEDADGKMNRSVVDIGGEMLIVSQFTLLASTRKGARPSFNDAAKPEIAVPLYEAFLRQATANLGRPVATGKFGAMMKVALTNDGPVTIVVDSKLRE
jgi:D-tyrosyl-tRNA(Tyr) deacylase